MRRINLVWIGVVILLISGCSKEYELKRSVFVEDTEYPGLPRYSELGYNTFGAYYDRQAFISSDIVPVKVESTNGKTSFIFSGRKEYSNDMSLSFELADLAARDYSDLLILNGKTLDLTDPDYSVSITANGSESKAQIITGTFVVNRIRKVIVDTKEVQLIISGTFGFQAIINGQPVALSDGRFDVSVYDENFFVH